MPDARPLPAEIGAAQHAFSDVLDLTLEDTAIDGHDPWVFLNISEAFGPEEAVARATQVLRQPQTAVETIRAGLITSGQLESDGSLTPSGREALMGARALVGRVNAELAEGIDPEHLAIATDVLIQLRERAQARVNA